MIKYFKHISLIITSLIILGLLTSTISFIVLRYWVLTPQYLASTIKETVSQYSNLDFDCKSIELEYLNSWPSISIAINEGRINLPVNNDSTKTGGKLSFQKLYCNIQLRELLSNKSIQIEGLFLKRVQGELLLGTQLPQILKKQAGPMSKTNKFKFRTKQIHFQDADFDITYRLKDNHIEIQNASIFIDGELTSQEPSFKLNISCPQIGGKTVTNVLGGTTSFSLQGECRSTEKFNDITLVNTSFFINQFPFRLNGNIYNLNQKHETSIDLSFNLLASKLDEILDFMPFHIIPKNSQYIVTGNTILEGKVKGNISNSEMPDFKLKCSIDKGSFHKKGINKGIDTIKLCMDVSYLHNNPDSCYISLQDTKIKGLNSYVEVQSHISNFQKAPFITADLKGHIDFDQIGKEFILPDIVQLNGKLNSNLSLAFNLTDLIMQNLNRIWISGTFDAPYVKIQSPKYDLDIFVEKAKADIGYKKNKSDFIKDYEILSANLNVDTLKVQCNKKIFLNLSKLNLRSNTSLSQKANSSIPLTAHLNCAEIQSILNNNKWITAQEVKITAGTKSVSVNSQSEAACLIQAGKFLYLDKKAQNIASLIHSEFIAEFYPNNNKKWDFKGLINWEDAQLYTSEYPINIKSKHAHIEFKNNQISMNHLHLNIGKSDCLLSGVLTQNTKPMPDESKVEGTLHVLAEYIDYNELKETFLYKEAAQKQFDVSNIQNFKINELAHSIEKSRNDTMQIKPFFIPNDINIGLTIDINHMNYGEIDLHQVNGNMEVKGQKVFTNLFTHSNLGKASLTALYETMNKEKPRIMFDLNLQDILIAQIHHNIPELKTLFPMVTSMDGLANCHLTLSSQLDNQMLPILSTTEAICSLDGENLTLINNEIFQNIAKKLRFKNKDQNVINQLSANLILKNNLIEVIPFQIKWDRYEAIVGGTHSTDFNFNYHISMLKSPIPFDLGVNIYGKLDELHYKTSKCKYKDLFKDDGAKHKQETKERLDKERNRINEQIWSIK